MPAENCHHRFDVGLFHGHWSFEFDIDSYNCPLFLSKMIGSVLLFILTKYAAVTCLSHISDSSSLRKWFVSLKGINTLVTFRQPWHNCAINVTDRFAASCWLALNQNYITVQMEDITCKALQWHVFVSSRDDVKHLDNIWCCTTVEMQHILKE